MAEKGTEMQTNPLNGTSMKESAKVVGKVEPEVDYEAASKGLSFGDYIRFRFRNSNITKYYHGTNLTEDEADSVVNALALVAALILTIPFGAAMSFDNGYWDWLNDNIGKCTERNPLSFYDVYNLIALGLYAVAYSSMTSLAISIFYYVLRPKGPYFKAWWHHGKIAVLLMCLGVTVSIISMLTLFGSFMGWYVNGTDSICEIAYHRNKGSYATGITFIVGFAFVGFCLMI